MAPLRPHWKQPSHPDIQEVKIIDADSFTSNSYSKVALPAFGVFAKLGFPPCLEVATPAYSTVQYGPDKHLELNSDLVYINHSCEPSLIFDLSTPKSLVILAGQKGLKVGDELTFFYPSTEWKMAQPFVCHCRTASCRKIISGAADMSEYELKGVWLNSWIREQKEEQELEKFLARAKEMTQAAAGTEWITIEPVAQKKTWPTPLPAGHGELNEVNGVSGTGKPKDGNGRQGPTSRELSGEMGGDTSNSADGERKGPTSRELSGEMGGDTDGPAA